MTSLAIASIRHFKGKAGGALVSVIGPASPTINVALVPEVRIEEPPKSREASSDVKGEKVMAILQGPNFEGSE